MSKTHYERDVGHIIPLADKQMTHQHSGSGQISLYFFKKITISKILITYQYSKFTRNLCEQIFNDIKGFIMIYFFVLVLPPEP